MTTNIDASLAGARSAASDLMLASDRAASSWTTPRAPGKWSPSQVVEHVTRILEESASVAEGGPSNFPTLPFVMRPIVRMLMFRRILKRNSFLRMKAAEPMVPTVGSENPAAAGVRLEAALDRFDGACRARAANGERVKSTIFGPVPADEFARFQELHIRHHIEQMPGQAQH